MFFSHNVFHSNISLVCQNAALCGNGLTKDIEKQRSNDIFEQVIFTRSVIIMFRDRVNQFIVLTQEIAHDY